MASLGVLVRFFGLDELFQWSRYFMGCMRRGYVIVIIGARHDERGDAQQPFLLIILSNMSLELNNSSFIDMGVILRG